MARVPKTSGQGTSRKTYQTGYRLGNRGSAAASGGVPTVKGDTQDTRSSYAKDINPGKVDLKMNVSYGDTIEPGDLKDVKSQPPPLREAPAGLKMLNQGLPKKIKGFKL